MTKLQKIVNIFLATYNSVSRKKESFDSIVHHSHLDKEIFIGLNGLGEMTAKFDISFMAKSKLDKLFKTFESEAKKEGFKVVSGVLNQGESYDEVRYMYIDDKSITSVPTEQYEIQVKNSIKKGEFKNYKGSPMMITAIVYGNDFNRYNVWGYATPDISKITGHLGDGR